MTCFLSVFRSAVLSLACVCVVAATARAETALLVLDHGRGPELVAALEQALSGHNARFLLVTPHVGASGALSDMRALATRTDSGVVVWMEAGRLRALGVQTDQLAEAPLPEDLASIDARTFAVVAGSLVLEVRHESEAGTGAEPDGASALVASPESEVEAPAEASDASEPAARGAPRPPSERAPRPLPPAAQPSRAPRPFRPRFLLRVGGAFGLAVLRAGLEPDRPPGGALMNQVAFEAGMDAERARNLLYENGFDCNVSLRPGDALVARQCAVALRKEGYARSRAIQFDFGLEVLPRLSLVLTSRMAPDAGFGVLVHAVLGVQGEVLLTPPAERGTWAKLAFGAGFGQIQTRPYEGPYVRSGPLSGRLGVLAGYRFHPLVGMFVGVFVHRFFPDPLWAVDPSVGLELRL